MAATSKSEGVSTTISVQSIITLHLGKYLEDISGKFLFTTCLSGHSMSQESSFAFNYSHVVNELLTVPSQTLKRNARSST